jgi:hypothetical protein
MRCRLGPAPPHPAALRAGRQRADRVDQPRRQLDGVCVDRRAELFDEHDRVALRPPCAGGGVTRCAPPRFSYRIFRSTHSLWPPPGSELASCGFCRSGWAAAPRARPGSPGSPPHLRAQHLSSAGVSNPRMLHWCAPVESSSVFVVRTALSHFLADPVWSLYVSVSSLSHRVVPTVTVCV